MTQPTEADPDRIYLEPHPAQYPDEGRQWCEDKIGEDWIEYRRVSSDSETIVSSTEAGERERRIMELCRVSEVDLFEAEEYALEYGGKRGKFNLRAAANEISRRIRERVRAADLLPTEASGEASSRCSVCGELVAQVGATRCEKHTTGGVEASPTEEKP